MNAATVAPCKQLSSGRKKLRAMGRIFEGWSDALKERVASQVDLIRHWIVIEDDYAACPNFEATWYIDPPYQKAGKYYIHGSKDFDFASLASWCRTRRGQVMVCEAEGADWLPFRTFATIKASDMNGKKISKEVIWTNGGEQ